MELKTKLWNFIPNTYNTIKRIKSGQGGDRSVKVKR